MLDFQMAVRKAAEVAWQQHLNTESAACRVYVTFEQRLTAVQSKLLGQYGFKVTARPYAKGKHLYMGYQNFSGQQVARARCVAEAFSEAGFAAYSSEDED